MWAQQVAGPHVSHPRAVAFKAPKQRPPRHDPGLPSAPTFENANESSFICKRICMYYHARVFLAIISHSKRDTPSVHFCKSFQTTYNELFCTLSEMSSRSYKSEQREYYKLINKELFEKNIDTVPTLTWIRVYVT